MCSNDPIPSAGSRRSRRRSLPAPGCAYALVHTIEETARDFGCFRLEVTTQPDRADALSFYLASGFEERPRRLTKPLEHDDMLTSD